MYLLAKGVGVNYGPLGQVAPAPADHEMADLALNKSVHVQNLRGLRCRFLVRFRALR